MLDGFVPADKDAYTAFDPRIAASFFTRVDDIGRRLGVRVGGLEHLPAGRALLVANHAFGWDVVFPMAAIWRATGRRVWALGEHAWWKFPFVRRLAAAVGTVDGTSANVDRLLGDDELVLVLPGGLREAMKPHALRYRLMWGHRYGFVRAAARNHAPLVPLACVGSDDLVDWVGDAFDRGARWLGRSAIPIPRPSFGLPIIHRVRLGFTVGEPVPAPPSEDEASLARARREVEGAIHEMIEHELAQRAGVRD